MSYNKPLPQPNPDTKPFWNGCKQHELRFQKCVNCGHVRWPPSIICPRCHSKKNEWIVSSGEGTVYTFAVYHLKYHEEFEDILPYTTAIVELEEGPHILSNIVKCDSSEIHCGMAVEVVWEDVTEDVSLPKFKPKSYP